MSKPSDTTLRSPKSRKGNQKADGGGLYAERLPSGVISFLYQYRIAGRTERVVLGTYPALPLIRARQKHREYQTLVEQGQSPARQVQQKKAVEQLGAANTFESFARATNR